MPYDKKDENPYIEGVPVKISEKYKPPPVIRIPNSCQNCNPGPALYEEYDFKYERNVLSQLEELKKAREEQTQRRKERLEKLQNAEEEAEKLKAMTLDEHRLEINEAVQANVLTPTNVSNTDQVATRRDQSAINYSDFETDTSSPFDNVELKTINEMEILASVLSTTISDPNQTTKPPSLPSNNNCNIPTKNGIAWNGYNMYSSPQYYEPSFMNAYPTTSYVDPSHSQWMSSYPSHPTAYRYNSVDPSNHVVVSDTVEESRLKNNSKSVPDLVQALQNELKEKQKFEEMRRKTKTPPPRPTLSKGLEDWQPWPDFESPRPNELDCIKNLPSPLQALANDIREMGFPPDRIVRTITKFNGDDKRVIEFLLQVQRFEEKKFKGDLVEKALHANKYDEKETLKHLEAAVVLLDLGFDPEKVEKTLLESKNDRDSALERLIS